MFPPERNMYTVNNFRVGINFLLNNRFGEAARRASSILRDNPMPIMDKAVFWIEYVIRHKGAPHLRTTANDLYWFQYYLLDVTTAISIAIIFVSYLNYKCYSYLSKKICAAKSSMKKVCKKK